MEILSIQLSDDLYILIYQNWQLKEHSTFLEIGFFYKQLIFSVA